MINLQLLIQKLTVDSKAASEAAAANAAAQGSAEVSIEHLLAALAMASSTDAALIFSRHLIKPADLQAQVAGAASGARQLSPNLIRLLNAAWTLASLEFSAAHIRSAMLLLALLETEDLFRQVSQNCPALERLSATALRRDWNISLSPAENEGSAESNEPLDQYTIDLTSAARHGDIDPVIGREKEIRQVIDILTRRRQNNPILTGEAGVGKTAIVEGFALRVASGDVPPSLRNVSVRSLDLGLLQAGAGVRGEFEARLKSVVSSVKGQPIILFIDEAHTLISDGADLLKPALARGELRTIAATTHAEYRRYFERDAALARRFQVVRVEEPSEDEAVRMVRGIAPAIAQHHGVRILDEAVRAAVLLSHRYVTGRQLPDKAVNVLDTACARVALNQTTTPAALADCRQNIDLVEQEIAALKQEAAAGADHESRLYELFDKLAVAETQLADLEDRCREEGKLVQRILRLRDELEANPATDRARLELEDAATELSEIQGDSPLIQPFVNSRTIAEVISAWTGVPAGQMVQDEAHAVLNLRNLLAARVVGQDEALETIARRIRTARAGLEDPGRPSGVFLLAGPSGVGKTETALALSDILYGGERNAVVTNMSEYQEAHSVSGLKGSPPGYVGYGEGGVLTEAVRRRPYSVLLLDEFEKAHADVLELFYQVFDKGTMEDAQGREINFRNTIILATSNAGSATIQRLAGRPIGDVKSALGDELSAIFKPALLGRMVVVPYFPLDAKDTRRIVELKLDKIAARLEQTYQIAFSYTEALVEQIAESCVEFESGARNIDHILTDTLLPEISKRLLSTSRARLKRILADAGASGMIRLSTE